MSSTPLRCENENMATKFESLQKHHCSCYNLNNADEHFTSRRRERVRVAGRASENMQSLWRPSVVGCKMDRGLADFAILIARTLSLESPFRVVRWILEANGWPCGVLTVALK